MDEVNKNQELSGPITDSEARRLFRDYYENISPCNKKLLWKVYEYDRKYFRDMRFCKDSIVHSLIAYKYRDQNGEWVHTCIDDFNLSLRGTYWRVYVDDTLDKAISGETDARERTIRIRPEYADDPNVILHEMIHAHEVNLTNSLHEILLLCLYQNLSDVIPDLEARLVDRIHILHSSQVTLVGGEHDALFFLKSLSLDIQMGNVLETIFWYRDKEKRDRLLRKIRRAASKDNCKIKTVRCKEPNYADMSLHYIVNNTDGSTNGPFYLDQLAQKYGVDVIKLPECAG